MVFNKKPVEKPKAPEAKVSAKPVDYVRPEGLCVEAECSEPLAPGQTYVCHKHIRRG